MVNEVSRFRIISWTFSKSLAVVILNVGSSVTIHCFSTSSTNSGFPTVLSLAASMKSLPVISLKLVHSNIAESGTCQEKRLMSFFVLHGKIYYVKYGGTSCLSMHRSTACVWFGRQGTCLFIYDGLLILIKAKMQRKIIISWSLSFLESFTLHISYHIKFFVRCVVVFDCWLVLFCVVRYKKCPPSSVTVIGITFVYNVSMEYHCVSWK